MLHGTADLLLAAAWFAVFGVLQGWYSDDEGLACASGNDFWSWERECYPSDGVVVCETEIELTIDV